MFRRILGLLVLLPCLACSLPAQEPMLPADLLAEGPLEVTVLVGQPDKLKPPAFKAMLYRLTRSEAFFFKPGNPEIITMPSGRELAYTIETTDGKSQWEWASKQYTGPTLLTPTIDTTPLHTTPEQEVRYLYFSLERLRERLDVALRADDRTTVANVRKRVRSLEQHARAQSALQTIADLFADIEKDFAELTKLQEKRVEVRARLNATLAELNRGDQQKIRARANLQAQGIGNLVVGGLPALVDIDQGRGVHPVDALFVGVGLRTLAEAARQEAVDRSYLAAEVDKSVKAAAEEVRAAEAAFQAAGVARRTRITEFGSKHLGMNDPEGRFETRSIIDQLASKRDREELQKVLTNWVAYDRGNGDRDNPFRLAMLYECQATVPRLNVADQVSTLEKCVADTIRAVKLVPAGAIYDLDRAALLLHGATLANRAAQLETDGKSVRKACSFNALMALRLLARVDELKLLDLDGLVREQKFLAMTRSAQITEAAEQALRLGDQLTGRADSQFLAAQVFGSIDRPAEVAKFLDGAMLSGYDRLDRIRTAPDLKKHLNAPTVKPLFEIKLKASAILQTTDRLNPANHDPRKNVLKITNESKFPLTNVAIAYDVHYTANPKYLSQQKLTLDRLAPGATYQFTGAAIPPAQSQIFSGGTAVSGLLLSCDQLADPKRPYKSGPILTELK